MDKKQDPNKKKAGMNLILGAALVFLAVVLISAAVGQIQTGKGVSAGVSICGVLLFGSVGVVMLVGEIRQWLKNKK